MKSVTDLFLEFLSDNDDILDFFLLFGVFGPGLDDFTDGFAVVSLFELPLLLLERSGRVYNDIDLLNAGGPFLGDCSFVSKHIPREIGLLKAS